MDAMNCCRKQSCFPLRFRKEPWVSDVSGLPAAGWAGVRMGSVEEEGSLCSLAVDCLPCFRTQCLLLDVLPGVFNAFFSVFMRLLFC